MLKTNRINKSDVSWDPTSSTVYGEFQVLILNGSMVEPLKTTNFEPLRKLVLSWKDKTFEVTIHQISISANIIRVTIEILIWNPGTSGYSQPVDILFSLGRYEFFFINSFRRFLASKNTDWKNSHRMLESLGIMGNQLRFLLKPSIPYCSDIWRGFNYIPMMPTWRRQALGRLYAWSLYNSRQGVGMELLVITWI